MKNNKALVEDRPDLVRDLHTKAILCVDKDKLNEYKNKKIYQNKHKTLNKEINNLKKDINEIKSMLTTIIQHVLGDNNEKSKNG
jgi:hypothetical protein